MRKNSVWLKSLTVSVMVLLVMAGAGFYLFAGDYDEVLAKVESPAAGYVYSSAVQFPDQNEISKNGNIGDRVSMESEEEGSGSPEAFEGIQVTTLSSKKDAFAAVPDSAGEPQIENKTVKIEVETPAPAPAVAAEKNSASADVVNEIEARPVSYKWGSSGNYTFRIEVTITNNGSDTARGVTVAVPLLENDSPYQSTSLESVNYPVVSKSGRVSSFSLGDLEPGESKTITADFAVTVRKVSIDSSDDTVEKAKKIFEEYAGAGNCRDLALAFISKSRAEGINAREVIGFARPQRGDMTAGSLQGARHSWAEFYVDGLGWVPVDLTFEYFGTFPHTSHIVESYSDQSLKVSYTGGSLNATWSNVIL